MGSEEGLKGEGGEGGVGHVSMKTLLPPAFDCCSQER